MWKKISVLVQFGGIKVATLLLMINVLKKLIGQTTKINKNKKKKNFQHYSGKGIQSKSADKTE